MDIFIEKEKIIELLNSEFNMYPDKLSAQEFATLILEVVRHFKDRDQRLNFLETCQIFREIGFALRCVTDEDEMGVLIKSFKEGS